VQKDRSAVQCAACSVQCSIRGQEGRTNANNHWLLAALVCFSPRRHRVKREPQNRATHPSPSSNAPKRLARACFTKSSLTFASDTKLHRSLEYTSSPLGKRNVFGEAGVCYQPIPVRITVLVFLDFVLFVVRRGQGFGHTGHGHHKHYRWSATCCTCADAYCRAPAVSSHIVINQPKASAVYSEDHLATQDSSQLATYSKGKGVSNKA